MSHDIIAPIAKAVVGTLSRLGITQEDLLAGALNHTQLVWQVPPLIVESNLDTVPLYEYTDRPVPIKVDVFYQFWCDSMIGLRNNPHRTVGPDGYRLARASVRTSAGERKYRLSIPEGHPLNTTEYAGAILSLEAAHMLRHSVGCSQVVDGPDDYYVVTHEGFEVGVKDGYPLTAADQWDMPVHGMVHDFLRMPRGEIYIGSDFDMISRLRSHLWDHRQRVGEFEACDQALQLLRVFANGENVPEILHAVQRAKVSAQHDRRKLEVLRQAVEMMNLLALSDRQKIVMLRDMLVPEFVGSAFFTKKFYGYYQRPPPILSDKVRERIINNLQAMLHTEELRHANQI